MNAPRPVPLDGTGSLRDQVARNIRAAIDAGVLRHQQALPSTREMAERWRVSVFTITEAMKILDAEGLIITKSRSNRVVNAPDQPHPLMVVNRPQVVLIGGYAGSGKTELARILARRTAWPVLDKDTLTRPVIEAALEAHGHSPHDRESELYQTIIRPLEYEALMATARENAECGNCALVAAPFVQEFSDSSWLSRTRATFVALGADVTITWVYCDPDTMHSYLRHRGAARDTAKLADWSNWLRQLDTVLRPSAPHVVVDNSHSSAPLQDQATMLLETLAPAANP
jgi:predicted kinase